jgi:hypothetical protein
MEKTTKFLISPAVVVITAILATIVCIMLIVCMIPMGDFVPKIRLCSPETITFEAADIRLLFIPLLPIPFVSMLP